MHTRHRIGLLAASALLLAGPGGLIGTTPAGAAETCGEAWSVVSSPDAGSVEDRLAGVSATSAADAWAVGTSVDAATGGVRALTQHWDGSAWRLIPSPNRLGDSTVLRATAAVSTSDVWAVGDSTTPVYVSKSLTEHWDGSAWTVVPSANAGAPANGQLWGVTAVSARDVWAVGSYVQGPDRTLIEHWNGARWTVVPSPNAGTSHNRLTAVDSVGPNDVWAIGSAGDYGMQETLIEHWDGSRWTVVPSPNLSPDDNRLTAVAAVAADDVWAVGVGGLATLVAHWDGVRWTIVPSPNPSFSADLAGVAAVSATDVWAVGGYVDETYFGLRTLVEHWNGKRWEVVASPSVPPGDNRLSAVTALGANQWAVGWHSSSSLGPVHTLTEQRCA